MDMKINAKAVDDLYSLRTVEKGFRKLFYEIQRGTLFSLIEQKRRRTKKNLKET